MKSSHLLQFFVFCSSALLLVNCSEDKPAPEQPTPLPPVVEKKAVKPDPQKDEPVVYIEELDQYQEYFKEQHETSFSHVTKKNWSSFTAGKNGILTKIMLFGKPNFMISEHYGTSMSGFIRADNPDSGPKYGEWSITREEIVNQLALQGLTETDRGWITLQMKGEIPQIAGKLYFMVCDQIGNNRSWFGAFAFAEGNSYKKGRFWLHPDHDLVFRTYVGKTADQLEREQLGKPLFDSETVSLVPSSDLPDAPKPMNGSGRNFVPSNSPLSPATGTDQINEPEQEEPLYQPATENVEQVEQALDLETPNVSETDSIPESDPSSQTEDQNTPEPQIGTPKGSLFERFFKNKSD